MAKRLRHEVRNGINGKDCSKCSEWKPLEEYGNKKDTSDGKCSHCKECERAYKGAKKRIFRTELSERDGVVGKGCGICREWLPLEKFLDRNRGLGGKRSDCIECERKRNLKYFREHTEERREYAIRYNKENREKITDRLRKWYKDNPDKVARNNHRRRARKLNLPDNFTVQDMDVILAEFSGCALTGSEDIHWDHVIPVSTGFGGTTRENMIPLRTDLNISKNDSNIFEWFERNKERFNLAQEKFDYLIENLASKNGMSIEGYRLFVYECFENKREVI